MPALGFGTLISDATETRNATRAALEAGFRHFDCAERYRNEEQVGEAIREAIQAGSLTRGGFCRRTPAATPSRLPAQGQCTIWPFTKNDGYAAFTVGSVHPCLPIPIVGSTRPLDCASFALLQRRKRASVASSKLEPDHFPVV
jgi:hypothetical protein